MMWIGLCAGFAMGVLVGFFGGGGSILTVPLLVYVFGLPAPNAIASSLAIVALVSLSGALHYARAGLVDLRVALLFGGAGMVGAYAGGHIGASLDGRLLLMLFAVMMGSTAWMMWRSKGRTAASTARASRVRLAAHGLGVGAVAGLVGAGGGFLIVPALTLWAGLPIRAAIGTSLVIIVLNSAAGFAGYAGRVTVPYELVAGVSAIAVLGSFVGVGLARRIEPGSLRKSFAGFVAVMAIVILGQEFRQWIQALEEALPHSIPQAVFAIAMLGVGLLLGRTARLSPSEPTDDDVSQGAGI